MGVINAIVSNILSLENDRQELFQACKNGYVCIVQDDNYTKVIFCASNIMYKGSKGIFTEKGLEIHHHMVFYSDLIHVTVEELIAHGAKDKR